MSELVATVFSGMIIDENERAYYVQKNGVTFRLPKSEGEHKLGELVEGFGYQNQNQDYCMTTTVPLIGKGRFSWAEVKEVRRDLGVFVDIGLPDKDIAVSLDELPLMRELWPKKGDRLMVELRTDEKNRIWAGIADEKLFQAMAQKATIEEKNKNITGTIYRLKLAGSFLITDDQHLAFIHPSERFQEPRLGEIVHGRVIGVRPDGILNVSLKPRAHEAISDDALMLIAYLERASEHKMPYTDKSSPEDIKQLFGISKGQFKRALGHLMKLRMIEQKDGYTTLIKKSN